MCIVGTDDPVSLLFLVVCVGYTFSHLILRAMEGL